METEYRLVKDAAGFFSQVPIDEVDENDNEVPEPIPIKKIKPVVKATVKK